MRRRTLLVAMGGTASAMTLAGCMGGDDDGDDGTDTGDDDGDDDNGDDDGVGSQDVESSIETVGQVELADADADARNVESEAEVSRDADTVTISGSLEAPTPCHQAVVTDVSFEDGVLRVYIELEEEEDADVCTQVISEIEYEATIIVPDEPDRIIVIHDDRYSEETAADHEEI